MTPRPFLSLFEKLEHLVHRLPDSLQQPILRELLPIKTLLLLQRPPRLVFVGDRSANKAEFLNALFGGEVLQAADDLQGNGRWQALTRHGRGTMQVLDARWPLSRAAAESALGSGGADLFVFLNARTQIDGESKPDLEQAAALLEHVESHGASRPRLLGLQFGANEQAREELHATLHTMPQLESRLIGTSSFSLESENVARLVELIGTELPPEAQLEMARLSGHRELQTQISQVVIKSATAICAAVGAQPIPLADFPILTAVQTAMVAGIMHISGREMSYRLAGEFLAALGASISAGLVLREGARAAVKLVPLWGSAISGGVAGAGTYSIGRASVAYFIEGKSIQDARGFFRKKKALSLGGISDQ